uniref:AmmeMemoRadiSam system protein B n=2 Tax=Ditylum brightwellii TaxID=49249 RepID=A0A7S4T3M2_9STRA|mmetsp:Transcript_6164/g.8070  ORF Transcript_6164/g.8070 Transcript_6164/m.8070 type:complete len:405 (-) Transcript_6164:198-1412(-)
MGLTESSTQQTSHSSSAISHLRSSTKKKKDDKKGGDGGYVRRAYHAGSWYDSSPKELNGLLTAYLADAAASSTKNGIVENGNAPKKTSDDDDDEGVPRAIISPHAGYSYSGPTAAYAYMALLEALNGSENKCTIKTIVVLHPSHHVRLDQCAVSGASIIETPLLNLSIDKTLRSQLLSTKKFTTMTKSIDEHEHSGEMQYPYIAKAILDSNISSTPHLHPTVLPIMVGGISRSKEEYYGQLLSPILARSDVFTIVSTDFCHWGNRFGYAPTSSASFSSHDGSDGDDDDVTTKINIHEYIEWLDKLGMTHIEAQRPGAFADYLRMYSNTICGRHPIAVWLNAIVCKSNNETKEKEEKNDTTKAINGDDDGDLDVSFVRYAQSGQVMSTRESSVSYASAVARKRRG